jgi:putative transposase
MWMQSLGDFIKTSKNKREIKRVTALKTLLCGYKHEETMSIFDISSGFISTWKKAFFQKGVDGLKPGYKESEGLVKKHRLMPEKSIVLFN